MLVATEIGLSSVLPQIVEFVPSAFMREPEFLFFILAESIFAKRFPSIA